jgi:hypothetical protein
MRRIYFFAMLLVLGVPLAVPGQSEAQSVDGAGSWSTLASPSMDPTRFAVTENVKIIRDRIHITLLNGSIEFTKATNGVAFGAVFHGQGKVNVDPPNPVEAQQLRLFTKQDKLDMTFTEATFNSTDGLIDDVGKQVKWKESGPAADDFYNQRQKAREDLGLAILPRLLQGVLSTDHKRTALFFADLKTSNKSWVQFSYDALDPEEISVTHWADLGGYRTLDTWMSFPAAGISPTQAWKDPHAKDDFSIRAYKIDAAVSSNADLAATTTITIDPRLDGQRALVFSLDSNLRIESIKNGQGRPLVFFQAREDKDRSQSYGNYVVVLVEQPLKVGSPQTLEYHYAGKRAIRKVGSGNYFCESSGWYPERPESFSARADFDITFHNPKNTILVATGEKTSDTMDGNTHVTTWKSEIPLAVAGFAYGDYKIYNDKAGETAVDIYANREPDDVMRQVQNYFQSTAAEGAVGNLSPAGMAKTMGIEMANTIRLFSNFFGPYPYQHLSVTSLPISYSYGQGWPGLIYLWSGSFLDATQRHAIGFKDGVELTDFFRGHESSHQWWGHRVGWKSYHDQWLSEGFAEFSGNLYVQYRENVKEYVNRWKREKESLKRPDIKGHTIESLGPIWMGRRIRSSETDGGSYQDLIYSKGGLVLHMLRMQLWDAHSPDPDHLFKDMMRDYCKTFNNQAASTDDFKTIVDKHMTRNMDADGNHKMDWFFDEYVYGTAVPQYAVHSTTSSTADGKTTLKMTVNRTGVPDSWKDVIPIYAHQGDKTTKLGTIMIRHATETINITIPEKIDRVTVNDYEDLLAEVKQ